MIPACPRKSTEFPLKRGMEIPVLEPRSERIARYKAERRRELAERYGSAEELPNKWVRREATEQPDSDGLGQKVNGRTRGVTNGVEAHAPAEPDGLRR